MSSVNRRRLRAVGAALLGPLVAGCFSYAQVPPGDVQPGARVRVHIAADRAGELRQALGYPVDRLRGEALATDGDTLVLQVASAPAGGGAALRQNVRLAPGDLDEVELQRLSWPKTGAVAGAAILVGGIIVASVLHTDQRNGQSNPKPTPNAARLPLVLFFIHP